MRAQFAALFACAAFAAPQAFAQDAPIAVSEERLPLAQVLDEIAATFDVDFVYEEELVAGLTAPSARGASSAYDALDRVLRGTGLTFRFTSDHAFTIESEYAAEHDEADLMLNRISVSRPDPNAYEWYGREVLREVLGALRREQRFANMPADFRLYLWMAEDGSVARLIIDGLDGSELRAAAGTAIGALHLDQRPPYDMPQPIGLSIRAQ